MFLIDDLLTLPVRGIVALCREIQQAALQEQENEAANIRMELSKLYMMLETGQIADTEFDAREKELLDRLDRIQSQESAKVEATTEPDALAAGFFRQPHADGATSSSESIPVGERLIDRPV